MNHKAREKDGKTRWTIAVDCDGVIHSYTSPWVAEDVLPDPPVEGAIEWLDEIVEHFDVVIYTTRGRTPEGAAAVGRYIIEHGGPEGLVVTATKPPALVYVDDRGWRFEGPGTFPTVDQIHRARPWNKP